MMAANQGCWKRSEVQGAGSDWRALRSIKPKIVCCKSLANTIMEVCIGQVADLFLILQIHFWNS